MERRIPTLAGLFFLVILLGSVVVFFEYFTRTFSSASGSAEPKNIIFANISDLTATVTWVTPNPATGFVSLSGTGQKNTLAYDERDATGRELGTYTSHSVSLQNLQPETEYAVKIISSGKTYTGEGKDYLVRSGSAIKTPPGGLGPAYGTITTSNNLPAAGALIYLTVEGGQTLSALSGKTGTWLIPLNLVRTSSLAQYLSSKERLTETIRVVYNGNETTATTDTLNDSPVPAMEIGKTYDFRRQQGNAANPNLAQASPPQVLGETSSAPHSFNVSLAQPEEGASLPTNLPLFSGTGIPGRQVSLVIGITNPLSGTTTVAGDGTWQFTPPQTLAAGLQSVTVTTSDQHDRPVALTHAFTVLKSGTQVLGIATPSATLTPTLSATPSPTSTLAGKPVPTSGTTLPTIILLLLGLALLGSGGIIIVR